MGLRQPALQRRPSTGAAPLSARCMPPLSQRQRPAGFAAPAGMRGALPLALFVVLATLIMLALAGEVLWNDAWQSPFLTFASLQVVFFVSHLTLLDRPKRGAATRLALLAPSLYLLADLVFNASYTFASPMRDLAIGVVGWHLTAKALDIGIVYGLEGKGGPRWCVPDWEKEAIEQGIDGVGKVANGKGGHAPSPFWKRTPLPRRPRWAVESNHLPTHWKLLPLPMRAIDCCVWALDVMFLRRPGTSLLFPSEMRALDWSKKRLESSGRARRETQGPTSTAPRLVNPSVTPFGYTETPLVDVCLELILVVWAVWYISGLDITPRPGGVYALPISQQLLISLSIGVVITFPADVPEAILIPLSQRWPLQLPCTAVIPYFRGVARSKSLTDLWGTRWHAFSKRDFVRLSLLIPIAPRLRALNVLKAFFWSAAFHSLVFVRVRPLPSLNDPLSALRVFYVPGCYGLFLGQGVLVVVENALAPVMSGSKALQAFKASHPSLWSTLQSLWVYGSLIWMARWLVAELVPLNLLTHDTIHAMSPAAQWRDYSAFWLGR